jgi:outer membrane protein OmpA-like peptidoglycan-associated protein
VRGTWLGRLNVSDVGRRLSRGILEEDVDAVVIWNAPPPSAARAGRDLARPDADEFRRRQDLAEATLSFRGGKIRFESGSASISESSNAALDAVLAELRRDAGLELLVKAFADSREAHGSELSMERARSVVTWLTSRGINGLRLEPRGCGSSRALWFGDTEDERAANRRAELVRRSKLAGCQPPASFAFAVSR